MQNRMQQLIKAFILRFTVVSFVLALLSGAVYLVFLPHFYYPWFPVTFLLVALSTLFIHLMLVKASHKKLNRFSNAYMTGTGVKLLLFVIYMGIYLYFVATEPYSFVVSFAVLYIGFTIFEVSELTALNKRLVKNQQSGKKA